MKSLDPVGSFISNSGFKHSGKTKEGDKAPSSRCVTEEGQTVRLRDLRGKKVVLYFYPKDDTPGCTKEACSFRDSFAKFKSATSKFWEFSFDAKPNTRNLPEVRFTFSLAG